MALSPKAKLSVRTAVISVNYERKVGFSGECYNLSQITERSFTWEIFIIWEFSF